MNRFRGGRRQRGLTLVELMISLVLGLLVIAGAVGIFMSNRRAYASTETLGRMQESGRVGFELMARDIREAGANPCGKNILVANTLNNAATNWYTNFAQGLKGYKSSGVPNQASGTDAIELLSATAGDATLTDYNAASANIGVSNNAGFEVGDIVMLCDYKQGAVFQITALPSSKIQHNPGGSVSPGNCTKDLNFPVKCSGPPPGKTKAFNPGAVVAHMQAIRWYVGDTANGKALFRATVRNVGGTATVQSEQVVEGIENMQITYLESGDAAYTDATGVADWSKVIAVRVALTLQARKGTEQGSYLKGTDNNALSRSLVHTITLRNRTA